MKILVTGASGFIGSTIVDRALSDGFDVWAGIRKTSSREYLQNEAGQFIDLHFSDKDRLKKQLTDFYRKNGKWDYIVHNAGVTKCKDKGDFDRVNYTFTENFVNALIECDMVPDKFVFMSSLSAFGPVREESMSPILLSDVPNPDTTYGKSKLKSERFLQSLPDFPSVILRPTGVYGPRDRDYFLMIKSVKQGFDFVVGRKLQYLTFIYVKDLVKAIFLALENKDVKNKAYFVSDGNVYIGQDFSMLIQKILGKKHVIRLTVPLPLVKMISVISEKISALFGKASTLNGDKYNIFKQRNWQCDISDLQKDLGFTADYDLEKGVEESIAWYQEADWI